VGGTLAVRCAEPSAGPLGISRHVGRSNITFSRVLGAARRQATAILLLAAAGSRWASLGQMKMCDTVEHCGMAAATGS
jgi:hypothetical protein